MLESKRENCVRLYYDCFASCDRETLTGLLTKDFAFASSYATYKDRDKMLDDIWPHVVQNRNRVEDLEFFHLGNQLIAKYCHAGSPETGICELFEFEENKIRSIKVYTSGSPSRPITDDENPA